MASHSRGFLILEKHPSPAAAQSGADPPRWAQVCSRHHCPSQAPPHLTLTAIESLLFQGHPSLRSSAVPNARGSPLALVSPTLLVLSPTPGLPFPLQALLPHLPAVAPSCVLLSVCRHSVMLVDTDLEPGMGQAQAWQMLATVTACVSAPQQVVGPRVGR